MFNHYRQFYSTQLYKQHIFYKKKHVYKTICKALWLLRDLSCPSHVLFHYLFIGTKGLQSGQLVRSIRACNGCPKPLTIDAVLWSLVMNGIQHLFNVSLINAFIVVFFSLIALSTKQEFSPMLQNVIYDVLWIKLVYNTRDTGHILNTIIQ